MGDVKGVSNSVLTNPRKEQYGVFLASFAVFFAASAYIVMVFVALPLAIHTIVNLRDGCNFDIDPCFAPVSESQSILTAALTTLRLATFAAGSLLGTLSDIYGRKPLMIFALSGYTMASILYLIGWALRSTTVFIIGSLILGLCSPLTPHGIAYISDVSPPNNLAKNLGTLQAFGYFFGLMAGGLIALLISALTTGRSNDLAGHSLLFYASFGVGFALSLLGMLVVVCLLPESLHPSDRNTRIGAGVFLKANPLGFLTLVFRNPYFFLIWLSGMFAWNSVGAQEAVTGGWWLRRYAISETNVFILFTVGVWISSGFGAAIATRMYMSLGGLKFSIHISAIMTIITAVVFALAANITISYITIALSFFASPVLPTVIALLMGQVDSTEKGTLAGAIRSSEALAKTIGIVVVGNSFAGYIAAFRPDPSCIPDDFDRNLNPDNDCECGVETCDVWNGTDFILQPSVCTLGELSQKVANTPTKFLSTEEAAVNTALSAVPDVFVGSLVNRTDDCGGAGLILGDEGLTTTTTRTWCSPPQLSPLIGCAGFSFEAFQNDTAFLDCEGQNATVLLGNCTEEKFDLYEVILSDLGEDEDYTYFHDLNQFDVYEGIVNRIFDVSNTDPICPDELDAVVNVCLNGPISTFPGLYPMMIMAVVGGLSYLAFIVAELFFIGSDQKYWLEGQNDEKEAPVEETKIANVVQSDPIVEEADKDIQVLEAQEAKAGDAGVVKVAEEQSAEKAAVEEKVEVVKVDEEGPVADAAVEEKAEATAEEPVANTPL